MQSEFLPYHRPPRKLLEIGVTSELSHERPAMPDQADVCLCEAAVERPTMQSWSV